MKVFRTKIIFEVFKLHFLYLKREPLEKFSVLKIYCVLKYFRTLSRELPVLKIFSGTF